MITVNPMDGGDLFGLNFELLVTHYDMKDLSKLTIVFEFLFQFERTWENKFMHCLQFGDFFECGDPKTFKDLSMKSLG